VQGISSITDYLLIADGNIDRHVIAIAKTLIEELKEEGEEPVRVEGLQTGDWIVLDYVEIMIHLFMPGMRDKYQLERLWPESKIVELEIDYSAAKWVVGEDEKFS
jgi:ribosome-associated protein